MKSNKWRLFRTLIPVILGILIVGIATWNYANPLNPSPVFSKLKYNLGVDLAGGTTFVYEIDPTKPKRSDYNDDDMVVLLKKRLDPADLYNITIRPLSEGRFEIILPTGGRHRAEAAQKAWDNLITQVKQKWEPLKDHKFTADQGRVNVLEDQIVTALAKANVEVKSDDVKSFLSANYQVKDSEELTGDKVMEIKNLIHRVGRLEFRILANSKDDAEALDYLRNYFKNARESWNSFVADFEKQIPTPEGKTLKDIEPGNVDGLIAKASEWAAEQKVRQVVARNYNPSEELQKLRENAEKGLAPPPPIGDNAGVFTIDLEGGVRDKVTYEWLEVGKSMLHDPLQLNNEAKPTDEKITAKDNLWLTVQEARQNGEIVALEESWQFKNKNKTRADEPDTYSRQAMQRTILYSREIPDTERLSKKDRAQGKKFEYFLLTRVPDKSEEVTGEDLVSATDGTDNTGRITVDFRLDASGGNRFYDLTSKNKPAGDGMERHLAVILDGYIMSAPTLRTGIRESGQITGIDSREEVQQLVKILRAGSLPATLKPQPVSEYTMGALLGDDTIKAGSYAILFAFLFVLVFMIYYYRFAGLVACVALLANLVLTIAFMLLVNAAFTLPGLAGLVLMLAMAVDANVLIYERIREERDRGASLALAIRNGYERAFPTIIDTHLSSIFTAVVLYVVGNDQLKGFGISLTVGLIISLYTALYMTRVIFDFWLAKGWLSKLSMTRWLEKPNINFMRIRNYWFTATVILTVLGLTLFLVRGEKGLNMDFVGGTVYSGQLKEKTYRSTNELRDLLAPTNQEKRLALREASEGKPQVEDLKENRYRIYYKSGDKVEPVVVRLPNAAPVDEIARRAQTLPEPSVELIYHNNEEFTQGDKSRLFTIRTTEKSNELARAMINRLLVSEEGETLQQETELEKYEIKSARLQLPKPGKKVDELKPELTKALEGIKFELAGSGRETDNGFLNMTLTFEEKVEGGKVTPKLSKLVEEKKLEGFKYDTLSVLLSKNTYTAQVQSLLREELRAIPVEADEDAIDEEENPTLLRQNEDIAVAGLGTALEGGQYLSMEVTLPEPKDGAKVDEAIQGLAGRLVDFPLPVRLETFDSQLAADTQAKALYAIMASWVAILMYLWFRFGNWTFGLAAVCCLVHDLCLTLGIIAFSHFLHGGPIGNILGLTDFKIDLPTIAALLTLIGFSVNDTIVVFDRIREVRGKNPNLTPEMINTSINQTLSRTILTSLIAFLVVLVLYIWGGNGIHLFAFVMVVGVIVGTYSSVFVACPLLLLFGEGKQQGVETPQPEPTPPAETAQA